MFGLTRILAMYRTARARVVLWFPLGITARLSISFTAVAILAAAANLIVEQGVSIVRTTHTSPASQTAPPIRSPAQRLRPAAIPSHINADRLALSIDRYERTTRNRAVTASSEATEQLRNASKDLDVVSADFFAHTTTDINGTGSNLAIRLKSYKTVGAEYLQLSDERRMVLTDHATQFEALTVQITASLEGAWRIFGHVFARQSLMRLRADLDAMRRDFAGISSTSSYSADSIQNLVSSEAAFGRTLHRYENALQRSEGVAWVERLRASYATVVEMRKRLVEIDARRQQIDREFSETGARIATAIPAAPVALVPRTQNRGLPATQVVLPASVSGTTPTAIPAGAVDFAVTTTMTVPGEDSRRNLVAWITTGVLALLITISLFTVRSVLIPVRKMLDATSKISSGETDVRVPRGGIKELDTLAIAFNQMATQLASARELTRGHQQQLEAKVEDRTRQLLHLAEHDPLTQLPNRRQLFALLNQAIAQAATSRFHVGVFFIDIDNFKNLNDSLGHAFGDRVLISIAMRLKETAQHFGFAARLGGDEFTVVFEQARTADEVREAGWKLVHAFQKPLLVDDRELIVSVSVGASLYPDHAQQAEALLSAADAALFQAKALGRSQLAVFTPELLQAATNKFTTEQGLRRAIERGEFELVYQPETNLETMEVGLVEALIRWRLPDGRLALPGEFLTVAEESGLIIEIGDWVIRTAIQSAARWHHGEWPEARVAINVSARQLLDQRFVERVQGLLHEFNLPPRCIEIELTETVLQTGPATIESLHRLRACGIPIALDDFGTGYSSLTSLEQLPLTRIKLDRSLIASVDTSSRSGAIARAIISLCSSLGVGVTAEGIERIEQFNFLLAHRSIHMQGFLIAGPVSGDELIELNAKMSSIMSQLLLSIPQQATGASVADIFSARPSAVQMLRHT